MINMCEPNEEQSINETATKSATEEGSCSNGILKALKGSQGTELQHINEWYECQDSLVKQVCKA